MTDLRTLQLRDVAIRAADPADGGADGGGATITGTAVPFDTPINYAGQVERFAPGSIDPDQVVGRPLLYGHNYSDPGAWLGAITAAHADRAGLHIEAQVLDQAMAGKLRAAPDGTWPGLSVGVDIVGARHEDDRSVTVTTAHLLELSLTPIPAYGEHSQLATVRHQEAPPMVDTPTVPAEVVDLAPIRERLDAIEARSLAPAVPPAPQVTRADVVPAFTRLVTEYARSGRQTRALADVVGSGNAGLLPPTWSSEVRGYVDAVRYLFSAAGSVQFPDSGTLVLPKITQEPQVAKRSTQKAEVASRALTTSTDTYSAEWFAGALDIAVELVRLSNPAVVGLAVERMLIQYAVATEKEFVADAEGAATAGGDALDFTGYDKLIAALVTQGEAVRAATGTFGDRVALTTASWVKLLSLVDADGRRLLATGGATNADGSAGLAARSVDLGGVQVFHSPHSTVDLMFNTYSLRNAELPPTTLSADNVALMGYDVGIIGATLFVPAAPAGIVKFVATP